MNVSFHSLSHTFPGRPAIEELSFRVPSGQFVAIVGPSGCGKSTLLRLAANLLTPTGGRIALDGQTPAQAAAERKIAWMAQSPALLPWLTARENVAIVGPSGCGKSTLLRLAANLLTPTGGRIALDGQTPTEAAAQRKIAWMAQSPALLPWLTARENVALAGKFLGGRVPRLSPEEALSRVGLGDSTGAYPFTLSGGMQQRLALARTLALPASLWLMDEPFAALDELTRERLAVELLDLWQPLQPTVLWVTHNLHEALRLAGRVLVLTPRPARLAADLTIDLPRPREEGAPGWTACLKRIRAALEDGVK